MHGLKLITEFVSFKNAIAKSMLRRVDASAFIDWQSQIHNAGQAKEQRAQLKAERTLEFVIDVLANALSKYREIDLFNIEMKLYHGWFNGLTESPNKRALTKIKNDDLLPLRKANLIFDWTRAFGGTNISALPHRLHPKLKIHLPNTLRNDPENGNIFREKMIDTAMACDLLCYARSFPQDWKIIMAEDDDIIPGIMVSENWSKDRGGKNILLRIRSEMAHLQLLGLIAPIGEKDVD